MSLPLIQTRTTDSNYYAATRPSTLRGERDNRACRKSVSLYIQACCLRAYVGGGVSSSPAELCRSLTEFNRVPSWPHTGGATCMAIDPLPEMIRVDRS